MLLQVPVQVVEHNPVQEAAHPVFVEAAVNPFDSNTVICASITDIGIIVLPLVTSVGKPDGLIALAGVNILL